MEQKPTDGRRAARRVGPGVVIGVLAAAAVFTAAGAFSLRYGLLCCRAGDTSPPARFQGWDRPDLVLVLTAQQHGYILPCGCSRPQVGGLERRYNFVRSLKGRGWPVVAVDLGDIAQRHGPQMLPNVQGLIKYKYS